MSKMNARELALQVIYQVNEEDGYANLGLAKMMHKQQDMDSRDKGLATELVYGSIKYRGRLDWVIDRVAKPKVNKMDPWIRNIIRLGLYQMMFLDKIPTSAAVNESVILAKKHGKRGSEKFVNGVLRQIEREKDDLPYPHRGKQPTQYLSVMYSFPQWMVEKWHKAYGLKQTEALCQYFNQPAPLWIRTNTLKTTTAQLTEALQEQGIEVLPSKRMAEGLCITSNVDLNHLTLFQEGHFTIQDESSMHVARASGVQPGQRVLDVCSAPGGKTTHMAQLMENTGTIVACDIHGHRLKLIEENIERLGITNTIVKEQDGLYLADAFTEPFDVVLVDAPCSGLGVLGRRADARWSKRVSDIPQLVQLQQNILRQAALVTKVGGTLLYSTCTMTNEENEQVMQMFLTEHPNFILDKTLPQGWLDKNKGEEGYVQFVPFEDDMDGFFIAKFLRRG